MLSEPINLTLDIMKIAKKEKIKSMEKELKEQPIGVLMLCPFCNYVSKKSRRGTAQIFENKGERFFICYCCRKWRVLK